MYPQPNNIGMVVYPTTYNNIRVVVVVVHIYVRYTHNFLTSQTKFCIIQKVYFSRSQKSIENWRVAKFINTNLYFFSFWRFRFITYISYDELKKIHDIFLDMIECNFILRRTRHLPLNNSNNEKTTCYGGKYEQKPD